ncbi:DNA polymerase delta, subunit 4-domain-containing protein [Thelephora terrestris]|uniref:DNA polymerase delta, subunit 4-domain-containing protein n=1 Tax=Thelephora terrestris TaxID=56493 RepID=A0A9P6L6Z2_9AGAM|nr:DNA polymerase delta, subunit 4-domain-containing protein [Thelephora terrestris]
MVATRKSKTQSTLKQSKLSFSTKRAHSSKVDEKKQAPIRKTGSAPIPASAKEERVPAKRPRSPDPLEISSDSNDETETERPTPESVKAVVESTPPAIEEVERERLNPKDRKWNKHYASVKKMMGGLPAVHGEKQTKIHEILRVFDLSYKYGPCIGTTRMERWERAKALGLDPPIEVFEILSTKEGHEDQEYVQNVLYGEL